MHQCRLAHARRAEDTHEFTGLNVEAQATDDRLLRARRLSHQIAHDKRGFWLRQLHGFRALWNIVQQADKALVGLARLNGAAPRADGLLNRRQTAAHDNGRGNHHTGSKGRARLDRQVSADAKDTNLQTQADRLGHALNGAKTAHRARGVVNRRVVLVHPTGQKTRQHAHGFERTRVLQRAFRKGIGLDAVATGLAEQTPRGDLGDQGQQEDNDGTNERHPEQPRMQEPQDANKERCERRIKEGEHRVAAQEVPKLVEVAQRLRPRITRPRAKGCAHAEQRPKDLPRQLTVHKAADVREDPRTRGLQHGQQQDQTNGNAHEGKERRFGLRRDNAIVNLQHEDRADEQQQVGKYGRDQDSPKTNLRAAKGLARCVGCRITAISVLRRCSHACTPFKLFALY